MSDVDDVEDLALAAIGLRRARGAWAEQVPAPDTTRPYVPAETSTDHEPTFNSIEEEAEWWCP